MADTPGSNRLPRVATKLTVHALTPDRWADLETIFTAPGCAVARGCWCMCYRRSGAAPERAPGLTQAAANKAAFKALVDAGEFTGLIGYRGRQPVGWISVAPREQYAKLQRSPVMKPVDEQPVWSIVCFVVPGPQRGGGVARALLAGAARFARQRSVVLEAYPVDKVQRSADDSLWFGAKSMFDEAGFDEVARRKATRPVVRLKPV